jgi:hypothetical protein
MVQPHEQLVSASACAIQSEAMNKDLRLKTVLFGMLLSIGFVGYIWELPTLNASIVFGGWV